MFSRSLFCALPRRASPVRYASGRILADSNVSAVLSDKEALADLLTAVWNRGPVVVQDTSPHVRRSLAAVTNDRAATMTFDGFAHVRESSCDAQLNVAVDVVRSVLEVQNHSKEYVPSRARMHAVVEDHHEFVETINRIIEARSAALKKGEKYVSSATQYAAFEQLSPVQVITICGYAPVCLAPDAFAAAAAAANYTETEVQDIVSRNTRRGKLWYDVENVHMEGASMFVRIRPDVQTAVGRMSAQGKREMRVPVAHIPPAVEVIRPQLQGGSDGVPSYMADYLAENLSWTFVYVPIIKVRPDVPPRLRDWAAFLTASDDVDPHLRSDAMFSRLLGAMSKSGRGAYTWDEDVEEVTTALAEAENRAQQEAAAKEAALEAKEAALEAKEAERTAKEAALEAKEAALEAKEAERTAKEAALEAKEAAEAELAALRASLKRQ